jgi:hypothetical protein
MLTPLPWRRPWKVASRVATLDQLSAGRAILGLGVGAIATDLPDTGEVTDIRGRAERLDDGIDLMRALWAGSTSYHGPYYDYETGRDDLNRACRPVQQRIPVWVVGVWPRPKSMRRVLRCDGIIPQFEVEGREPGPDDARAARDWLTAHGAGPGLDMVAEGETPADDPAAAAAQLAPWADAGCTWWLETRWEMPHDSPSACARSANGSPPARQPGPREVARPPSGAGGAGYQPRNWPCMAQKAASAAMAASPARVTRRRRAGWPVDQRRPAVASRRASPITM